MERRRRAEKEQADRNLQAMGENAAYTERAIKQNREIALQNLKNESMQKIVDIQGAQQQAQTNAAATESIIDSIAGFSQTAAKVAAERTAKMIKDQTAIGLSSAAQYISTEAFEECKKRF